MITATPIASSVLVYQRELQRQNLRHGLPELYPTHKLYPVKRLNLKPIFSKLALPLADVMIQLGQQLNERYQPA